MVEQFDAAMWRNLEQLAVGTVHLDIRNRLDRSRQPGFLKLYEGGYCTLKETGPGDSINFFAITDTGRALLAARKTDNAG
jgi:hypothetical protein